MYREVTMFEVKEALRLWLSGTPKKRIAAQLGLDPKTVRHYVAVGTGIGLQLGAVLTEEHVRDVLLALQPSGGRPRGDTWSHCVAQREAIQRWLRQGVRLSKIRKLLARTGVAIPYPTLHRFAVLELQFGRTASTIPVADGKAGEELQVDTGWVGWLTRPLLVRTRRRFRAWIFTAVCSRYRFVYPTFEETTARAIEACEAAWEFFGGTFTVIIPDNTKAIIIDPDPLAPRITPAFLEYAQARNFISTPRVSGILGIKRASNAPYLEFATTAVPAKCSRRSTPRAPMRRTGVARSMGAVATVARSGGRGSISRSRSSPCYSPHPPRPTTSRCGANRRLRAINSPSSPRRSIRCRIDTSAIASRRGPISSSSASTNGGC